MYEKIVSLSVQPLNLKIFHTDNVQQNCINNVYEFIVDLSLSEYFIFYIKLSTCHQ